MSGQFLEVMPGREGASLRRDHHRADALVGGKAFELLRQGRQHRLRQAVADLRAVERENSNVADIFPHHDRLVRGCGTAGTRGGLSFHWHRFPGTSCISLLLSAARGRCKQPRNRECAAALRRKDNDLHVVARWQGKQLHQGVVPGASATARGEAGRSKRRKSSPFRSALSMLTFYINRAGKNLPASRKRTLMRAKDELRKQFGKA